MDKTYTRINWQNEPSVATPINDVNLNKMDYSLNEVDNRVISLDTSKADQSDLLQTVKAVTYDTTTGVFTFTFWNGTVVTADLNIEKIPVSFSMSPQGVITMTTADGTQYTADVSELIKTYSFADSSEIDFTVTTDASGNKTVTASIIAGSITGEKLQPNYLADCVTAKNGAETAAGSASSSATSSELSSEDSEAWAVGERNGQPVPSTDPAYENNAKWWAQHGTGSSFAGLSDTNFTNLQNGQIAKYNSTTQKWENTEDEGGLLPHFKITSEAGSTVTVVCPDTSVIVPTQTSSGIWQCDVPAYGVYTVHAVINGDDSVRTVTVDTVKEYVIHDEHYSYTLNVYAPTGSSIIVTDGGDETYTGTGAGSTAVIFALHQASTTYTITVTYDGLDIDTTITSSATSGGSGSKTITFGTINLTVDEDLIGETITMAKGTDTVSKVASSTSMVFYPNATGNWRISVDYEGETVYAEPDPIVVSSLSTPVSAEISLVHIPEGATVTPTDDIQTWLKCANLDKSYTTLAEVLADRETFETLIADSNACDYMARSTTWASDTTDDADAMALIGKYDYACKKLLANATWQEAIINSDYFENVLDIKVPKMTSATAPSGQCISDSSFNGQPAYQAFDENQSTTWSSNSSATSGTYVGYVFPHKVNIFAFAYTQRTLSAYAGSTHTVKIQGSNTGNSDDWHDISESYTFVAVIASNPATFTYKCDGSIAYQYFRMYVTNIVSVGAALNATAADLQFYGRKSVQATNTNGIIHTAMGNDSVYCVETGDTFTATDGIATVDFSQFDEGVYTFGSTTAKDPDNLSNDYTKQFKITKSPYGGTTELYLMPDAVNTLYWWGYNGGIEDAISANGWTASASYGVNWVLISPTWNMNNVSHTSSSNSAHVSGVVSKTKYNLSNYNSIKLLVDSSAQGIYLRTFSTSNDFINGGNINVGVSAVVATDVQHTEDISSLTAESYIGVQLGRQTGVGALKYLFLE